MKQIQLPYNFDPEVRPYQAQIWNDPRRNKVLVIHRRAGKTSLALNKLIFEAILNPNKVYWYICPTMRQAKDIVWKAPEMLSKYLPPEAEDKRNEVELTIYLKNGSQIHIKGADNPDSLRGMNPYGIIVDEYAQIKPQLYDEVIMPILGANAGWIWLIGTPNGRNDFWTKFKMAEQNLERWQPFLLQASKSSILSREVLLEIQQGMTERAFQQEFECQFLESSGQIFRRILENAKSTPEEPQQSDYFMGVDLARLQDWTVIKVFDTKTHREVYHDRFNQVDWNLQEARIEAVARRYNNALIRIDATGVGDPIVQALQAKGLSVEPFTLTNTSKGNLIRNLAICLEQDKIKILPNEQTINELQAFTYEVSITGNVRYNAPTGQHDDCFVKGTMILTDHGQVPIEKIKIGDLVMTRRGLRSVVMTRNRMKKVINNLGLTGTPTHPVILKDGIKDLVKVNAIDILHVWNEKLSIIEEKTITDIRNQNGDNCEFIIGDTISGKHHRSRFIDKYILIRMAKYLRAMLSTIRMRILSTTIFPTLKLSLVNSMPQNICLHPRDASNLVRTGKSRLRSYWRGGWLGEKHPKGKRSLGQMLMLVFIIPCHGMRFVWSVIRSLFTHLRLAVDFVVEFVADVLRVKRSVYNLQVAGCPEYFANNILVHNCVISLALAVWDLPDKPVAIDVLDQPDSVLFHSNYNQYGEPI